MIVFASSDGLLNNVLRDSMPTESAGTMSFANRPQESDFPLPKLIGITSFGNASSLQHDFDSHVSATGGFFMVIVCDTQFPEISQLLFGASINGFFGGLGGGVGLVAGDLVAGGWVALIAGVGGGFVRGGFVFVAGGGGFVIAFVI